MDKEYIYNEEKALCSIRQNISGELCEKICDEDLLDIIDLIWDFYDEEDLLEINLDIDNEEENVDLGKLIQFVIKRCRKNKYLSELNPVEIEEIVKAEQKYEESLEDFV